MDLVFSIFHHQRHELCNHPPFYPIRVNFSMHRPRENAVRKVAAESLVRGCPSSRRKEIQSSRRKRLFEEKKKKASQDVRCHKNRPAIKPKRRNLSRDTVDADTWHRAEIKSKKQLFWVEKPARPLGTRRSRMPPNACLNAMGIS